MNRKQRRAAPKQSPSAGGHRAGPARDPASELFAEAARLQRENKHADAARAYKRLLLLKPDHAEASNNLGVVLLAQGKRAEASACFARSLTLLPQLFEQFNAICETLAEVLPPIGEAMRRAGASWPNRLTAVQLFGDTGLHAVCDDPCCSACCSRFPARKAELELVLTSLRAALLADRRQRRRTTACWRFAARWRSNASSMNTCSRPPLTRTRRSIGSKPRSATRSSSGAAIAPMQLAALAMYLPLHGLPGADALLARPGRRRLLRS